MAATKTDLIKRIVRLRKRRQELEAELTKVKAEAEKVEPQVLEWLTQSGIDRISQDGITVHLRRELWASMAENADMDLLWSALDAAGIDPKDIIKERANTQSLSALVREYDQRGEPLPNSLAAAVKVSEVWKLGYRAVEARHS